MHGRRYSTRGCDRRTRWGCEMLAKYDRPFVNKSGENIPPYAVLQIAPAAGGTSAWVPNQAARDYFSVIKPNGDGSLYLVNGPSTILPNKPGRGIRPHGHPALIDPTITPVAGQSLGPVAGQWYLGEDASGFTVVGDIQGAGPSAPGVFPPVASTRRVRVSATASAAPAGRASEVYALVKSLTAGRWAWENGNVRVFPGTLVRDACVPLVVDPDQPQSILEGGAPWEVGQTDDSDAVIFYDATIRYWADDIEAGKGESIPLPGGGPSGRFTPPVRFVRGELFSYEVLNDQNQLETRQVVRIDELLNPLMLFQVSAPSTIAGIDFTAQQPLKIIGQVPIGPVDIDNSVFTFNLTSGGKLFVVRGRRPDSSANNVPLVNLPIQAACPAEDGGGGGGF